MPNQSETADNKDFIAANLPLLSFMKHCGESLGGILGGTQDPREVMFPGGSSDAVEKVYQDTPQSRYYNGIMAKALKSVVDALPFDRKISILEIGAGTGPSFRPSAPVTSTRTFPPFSRPKGRNVSPDSPSSNTAPWT